MLGLSGDRLVILLFFASAVVAAAFAAVGLSGWKAGVLWIVALICLGAAIAYAVKARRDERMAIKNNTFNLQFNQAKTAVKIDLADGGDFSENEMKVRGGEVENMLDVSGSGSVRRNKFDLESGKPSVDEAAPRTVRGWSPSFKLPWLK